MRGAGKLSWTDVLRLSSWEMAKLAPFFVIGFFVFIIFLPSFTFTKVSRYHAPKSGSSFTTDELKLLKENDTSLFERLDLNENGKIDGIDIQSFDTDEDGLFNDEEIELLQANAAILKSIDENNNTKIDAKEKTNAEESLKEINNANSYLGWDLKIYTFVLASFFLILLGIYGKYAYEYKTLQNRDVFFDKFPKFIGLKPVSLYVIAFGLTASIVIIYHVLKKGNNLELLWAHVVLFILVLSTTILFIIAFLRGFMAETIQSGKKPRGRVADTDVAQNEIRSLKWFFPSIPGDKYEGKEMSVDYGASEARFKSFRKKNKQNFIKYANCAPPTESWPGIYVSKLQSRETRELAEELYRLVNQYGLSEYEQVELFLAAVQGITYEKDSVSAPEMGFLQTDDVEAIEYPAKVKLSVLAYLYLKVAVSGSNPEGLVGFTDDEKEVVDSSLRDWYDEWNSENRIELPFSEVEEFIDEVIEYIKEEMSGEGGTDSEERFYQPAIEAFTPAQHRQILIQMEEIIGVEELGEEDERRSNQLMFIDYMDKRFTGYAESKGEYETTRPDEYPRYPTETLYEQKGDCEDTAMLLAALLRECRFEVQLLELESDEINPKTKQNIGHMACAVKIEGSDSFDEFQTHRIHGYVYCEPTHSSYRLGQIPTGLKLKRRLDVEPLPERAK